MLRPTYTVVSLGDRHALVKINDRIAVITQALKRPGKNGRRARLVGAYFGFATQDEAIAFVAGLRRQFPKAYCQVRFGQRLGAAVEVKVRAFEGLEMFTWKLAARPVVISPERARADLFGPELAIASNVVLFERPKAGLANRDRPKRVAGLSID